MQKIIPLVGRLFLSLIFLISGVGKIMDPAGTQGYMASVGMPVPQLFMVGAILCELGGGLSLLLGFRARWGAWILVIFIIPTTLIFHTKFSDQLQVIMFLKNLAILGGLLMAASYGAGPLSLDGKRR